MAASREESPTEDYFNDLSHQAGAVEERRESQPDENGEIPKPKRIACVLCRKRKLKCDGKKPACGTCNRLQHDCSYDEVRRKSGPKRGYVKALEARLAQVEVLLKTQDEPLSARKDSNGHAEPALAPQANIMPDLDTFANAQDNSGGMRNTSQTVTGFSVLPPEDPFSQTSAPGLSTGNGNTGVPEPFPWEMIGLGLDEPLPTQDVVNDLNQAYFDKIHLSVPIVHRPRYYAAMNLAPHMRPPVCLRYAMWANAASVTDKYEGLQEHFYQRARKYIQQDEMKGHGEGMVTIAHCQAWLLIGMYEFKCMYFPRAWMSAGRGSRMAQMMGLHRQDGAGLDVKQCIPPPKDWTEREERRRTFWMAFAVDRYSSIGTGWPMSIEESDICTNLPCEERAYEMSKPEKTISLDEALKAGGAPKLSAFAGVIVLSCLFGRNLLHLHRPSPQDNDEDLNGVFWKRHASMDNLLLNITMALPDALRLPAGLNDPNIVFMNMNVHTSTICLHQAAIFKADKNRMPSRISAESKVRCITAAAEIASIMRQVSHLDLSAMNPFISFCLYVAARVFVQYLKSRPQETQIRASLQFLLSAMHAIKRKNPLTESFLVQLDVDLESAGLEDARHISSVPSRAPVVEEPTVQAGCPFTMGMQEMTNGRCKVVYGDQGLLVYNDPNVAGELVKPLADLNTFDYTTAEMSDYVSSSGYDVQSRQRTPGSSTFRGSTSGANGEAGTSPEGSNDNKTPESSSNQNPSSRTSNTAYSPQDMQQQQQQQQQQHIPQSSTSYQLDPTQTQFTSNNFAFDLSNAPGSHSAAAARSLPPDQTNYNFSLPENWNIDSTGFTPGAHTGMTPGPTGFTPGASYNDMMTDADWTQMLDDFSTTQWTPGMTYDAAMTEGAQAGRR
ncbi:hypothetical protein LTR62_002092 [Meristemomyces frigidus]|uniref:Zn(2)-C6 fungal-type domain-containing protein n=1 Tax=Meristemomyces frigidus TaxID=1508187 RepID=A0AAN7YLI2_9PEZI|nr:hypothetical protein LTR62_002092 [Meristemomyces frigidus]